MPHPLRSWKTRPGWSEFGAPRPGGSWKTHRGFDYYAPEGTPIYGTADGGTVVSIKYNPNPLGGFGHSIRVRYPGGVETLDAHMKARSPLSVGDRVDTRTVLGYVGKTGNAIKVSWNGLRHDHHEVTVDGVRVDPIKHYGEADAPNPRPRKAKKNMTLYYTKKNNKNVFALAGDSPGTDANWLEFQDQDLANALAVQHGNAALLSPATFDSWKARYQGPVKILGGTGGDNTALLKAILDNPTKTIDELASRVAPKK